MSTFYEQVGGEKFFADLVSQFYAVVATDPILRPMYPETDMKGAAQRFIKKTVVTHVCECVMQSLK